MSYDEHLISMAGGDGEPAIDAIQARTDAATEGPYVLARYDHGGGRMFAQTASGERGVLVADTFRVGDREFHAEARADVLSLLALVREQAAKLGRVEALAEEWRYKGENGWGAWQEGEGPDPEGYLLDCAAGEVRAALTATEAGE